MKPNRLKIGAVTLIAGALLIAGAKEAKAVASALVTVTNGIVNPAVTLDVTRAAQNQILLVAFPGMYMNRIQPSGAEDITGFVVPAGKSLVITSIEAQASADMTGTVIGITPPQQGGVAYPIDELQLKAGTSSINFGAGIAVESGSQIYVSDSNDVVTLRLHGYLTPQ